jgi:hypothetical protein
VAVFVAWLFIAGPPRVCRADGLKEWICKRLKARCADAAASLVTRGGGGANDLTVIDPLERESVLLAACDCRSLSSTGDAIAYVRDDGIWLLPLGADRQPSGDPKRLVTRRDVVALLGTTDSRQLLFVARKAQESGAECYDVAAVALASGAAVVFDGAPRCFSSADLKKLPAPARVRGGVELREGTGEPERVQCMVANGKGAEQVFRPSAQRDERGRSGAIWLEGSDNVAVLRGRSVP